MTPMDGSNPKGDARLAAAVLGAEDAVDPRDLPPVMLGPDSTARIDASLARATCPACGSARPTNGYKVAVVDGMTITYKDGTPPKAADADGFDYYAQREWPGMLWRYKPGEKVGEVWSRSVPTWGAAHTERDNPSFDCGPATRAACEASLGWTTPEPVKSEQTLAEARASGFIDPSRLCGKCGGHGAVGRVLCDCRAGRERFAAINPPDHAADIIRGLTDLKESLAQARVMCENGLAQIEAYRKQWGIK